MAKRHSDALAIQEGAVNPAAIALAILDACHAIRAEPSHTGTAQVTGDPAVRLMVHQLAYICGITTGAEPLAKAPEWDVCMQQCKDAVTVAA